MTEHYDCELCNRHFPTPDEFYKHLKLHSKEEVELLRKIALRKKNMTDDEIRTFNTNLAIEIYNIEEELRTNYEEK